MNEQTCPLCTGLSREEFYRDRHRVYFRCHTCRLVFVPPAHYLSAEAEKAEYDLHQNSPDDPKYRQFLGRIFNPMQARLEPGSRGLDFGSGPGPTLSVMFAETGHSVAIYDHFYAKNPAVWKTEYDFITASEVIEHLHYPKFELERLWACLKPGGTLGIMTKLALNRQAFANWHYKNDRTHVCFYSKSTFKWLGGQLHTHPDFVDKDVILLTKKGRPSSHLPLEVNPPRFASFPKKGLNLVLPLWGKLEGESCGC